MMIEAGVQSTMNHEPNEAEFGNYLPFLEGISWLNK